jgi:hypothetical protein
MYVFTSTATIQDNLNEARNILYREQEYVFTDSRQGWPMSYKHLAIGLYKYSSKLTKYEIYLGLIQLHSLTNTHTQYDLAGCHQSMHALIHLNHDGYLRATQ